MTTDVLKCSFCGKSQDEVRKLIAGPAVYICDRCIELCNDIITEEWEEEKARKPPETPESPSASENPVVEDLTWAPEYGRLSFKNIRYLLIRPETLAGIHQALTTQGVSPAEILYQAGHAAGMRAGTDYRRISGAAPDQGVWRMAEMGGQIGWGAMEIRRLDPDRRELVLEVTGSPFAEALRPSTEPVCHLIRGFFGGLAEAVFGWQVTAGEDSCAAVGAPKCVFVIRSKGG